jgi:hypothetical protein
MVNEPVGFSETEDGTVNSGPDQGVTSKPKPLSLRA